MPTRDLRASSTVLLTLLLVAGACAGGPLLVVSAPLDRSDALLVFAGASVYRDRVAHAADLYRRGRADQILLTDDGSRKRWSRVLQRNPTSIELAIDQLRCAGVPEDAVHVLPGRFQGTHEEARAAIDYVSAHRLRSLVAVTSSFHTRRVVWTLRAFANGRPDLVIGSDPVPDRGAYPPALWWLTRGGWRSVAPEFIKLPYYWTRFGVLAQAIGREHPQT